VEDDRLTLHERIATAAGLLVYFLAAFEAVPFITGPGPAYNGAWTADFAIPFYPPSAWIYIWALPAATMPAFLTTSRRLFYRAAVGYVVAITVSALVFVLWPETAMALRPSSDRLDLLKPSEWLVANIYAFDPPGNLFPSLHLSITTLSAYASWRSSRLWGAFGFLGLAGVAISACTVKQHFVADVVGGLLLGASITWLAIVKGMRQSRSDVTPRSGLTYLLFVALFYAAIIGSFSIGARIHRCPDVTGACPT
jgi:PAP2 superfamily